MRAGPAAAAEVRRRERALRRLAAPCAGAADRLLARLAWAVTALVDGPVAGAERASGRVRRRVLRRVPWRGGRGARQGGRARRSRCGHHSRGGRPGQGAGGKLHRDR
eukprot:5531959-Prymnesium_polylepis.1